MFIASSRQPGTAQGRRSLASIDPSTTQPRLLQAPVAVGRGLCERPVAAVVRAGLGCPVPEPAAIFVPARLSLAPAGPRPCERWRETETSDAARAGSLGGQGPLTSLHRGVRAGRVPSV